MHTSASMEQRHGRGWAYPLAVALVCAGGLVHTGIGAIAAGKGATHTIVIEGTNYAPATLTIKRGDTLVWINKDPFPHTVTAKGVFDSHNIGADRSWKYTARNAGEFAYICTLHPNMKAMLKVE